MPRRLAAGTFTFLQYALHCVGMHDNEKPQSDRLMTAAEELTTPIQLLEEQMRQAVEIIKSIGLDTKDLEAQMRKLEFDRKVLMWLESFPDEITRTEAVARIATEGLPPEVFKDAQNFTVEGTHTLN